MRTRQFVQRLTSSGIAEGDYNAYLARYVAGAHSVACPDRHGRRADPHVLSHALGEMFWRKIVGTEELAAKGKRQRARVARQGGRLPRPGVQGLRASSCVLIISGSLTPCNKRGRLPLEEWIVRVPMLKNCAMGPCESVISAMSSSAIV